MHPYQPKQAHLNGAYMNKEAQPAREGDAQRKASLNAEAKEKAAKMAESARPSKEAAAYKLKSYSSTGADMKN